MIKQFIILFSFTFTLFAWNDSLIVSINNVRLNGGRVDWCHTIGKIAFDARDVDSLFDLWIMSPDGSDAHCLTCGRTDIPQRHIGQPAWHPSGRWIVFQCEKDPNYSPSDSHVTVYVEGANTCAPGSGWSNDLWCVDLEDTTFYRLTNLLTKKNWSDPHPITGVLHAHFSHDGRYLIYSELVDGLIDLGEKGNFGLWRIIMAEFDTSGGTPHLVPVDSFTPSEYPHITWFETHGFSPDDRKIIFTANPGLHQRDTYGDICVIDLATRRLTNLTPEEDSVWDEHAHISPDGGRIIWISSKGYTFDPDRWRHTLRTDWYIMNSDGSNKVRLTYFNQPGSREYTGHRTICADACWNASGDSLVGAVMRVNDTTGRRVITVTMIKFACPVKVDEPLDNKRPPMLSIFPNPFNKGCRIRVSGFHDKGFVKVFDLNGRLVCEIPFSAEKEGTITWLPDDDEKAGVYFIKVECGDNSATKRAYFMK